MLAVIPADDRDDWRNFGIILGREFDRSDAAWEAYCAWADKWTGRRQANHDETMRDCFHVRSQEEAVGASLSLGSIVKKAVEHGWTPGSSGKVPIESLVYYADANAYIYKPTGRYWVQETVNKCCAPVPRDGQLLAPAAWLDENRRVTSITKDPTLATGVIEGFDCLDGHLVPSPGAAVYNMYKPGTVESGNAGLAQPWIDHVRRVFDKVGDADQFFDYAAHLVQRPGVKIRFALLIAGEQGTGKDTAIEFCVPAIGAWNVASVAPSVLQKDFNEAAASTLLRINEAADARDTNRWALNESLKNLIAGSPDWMRINPKYGRTYTVRLYGGIVVTTNHLTSSIHIPPDDRRYDIIEAADKASMGLASKADEEKYFHELWGWFKAGGAQHVAAWLRQRDLARFSPNTGQRKTAAHARTVSVGQVQDHWLSDALEAMRGEEDIDFPEVVRSDRIVQHAIDHAGMKVAELSRLMPHAMDRAGYVQVVSKRSDGRWSLTARGAMGDPVKRRVTVYARRGVSQEAVEEQIPKLEASGF